MFTRRQGQGEPLVMIHGLGSAFDVWDRMAPLLVRDHELLTMDLPGFGDSPELPPGQRNLPAYADALEAEMDAIGWDRARVFGHSMGGWLALELARRGRATKTVALSPVGGADRDEAARSRRSIGADRKAAAFASRLPQPVLRAIVSPDRLRKFVLRNQMTDGDMVPAATIARDIKKLGRAPGFEYMLDEISGSHDLAESSAERFAAISTPVLIVWGTEDRVLSSTGGPRLRDAIPGAELRELPGLGHDPNIDHPELVARIAREFYERDA